MQCWTEQKKHLSEMSGWQVDVTQRGCSGALPPCPLGTVSWVTSDSTSPVSRLQAHGEDRAWDLAATRSGADAEVDYSYFFTIIMLCKT